MNEPITPRAITLSDDALVTVCAACKRASCWQGEFVCTAIYSAGIEQLTVRELRALDREHESYWQADK